jgi:hypothetical protein
MSTSKKGNADVIIAIVGGLAIIGVGLYIRRRNQQKNNQSQLLTTDGGAGRGVEPIDPSGRRTSRRNEAGGTSKLPKRPSYDVLTSIESEQLREYISTILDVEQAERLEGWMSLINQERNSDSSKWAISEGFNTMNGSDVAHSLFMMDNQGAFNWSGSVRDKIIELE